MDKIKKRLIKEKKFFYVAAYMRLSREDGDKDESDSIGSQRRMIMNYLDTKDDAALYGEYVDDGFSGTNFDRPDFQRMIKDIEEGEVNCVIVKDLSRFGRNYIDSGYYLEQYFVDKEIRFIAINDYIDSFVRDYDMLMPVKNIFNAQYARDISMKVQSSFKVKQRAGDFVGAFTSYGYKKMPGDRHRLVIDDYAADVVRRIFSMYISGMGKIGIAKQLNREGILCPSEYKKACGLNYHNCNKLQTTSYWTYSTVNNILKNEMYIGNMIQGKTKRRMKGKPKPLEKDEWIKVENTHDAIISQNTWESAQEIIKNKYRQLDLNENVTIFAGLLVCGDCGRAMSKKLSKYQSKKAKECKTYYCCSTYIKSGVKFCTAHWITEEYLKKLILNDLQQAIATIENLEMLISNQKAKLPKKKDMYKKEVELQKKELTKVANLKKGVYEDYKENLISKEEYIAYKSDYDQKEKLLQDRINKLSGQMSSGEDSVFQSEWIKSLLDCKNIKTLDRETILNMVNKIYIYSENIIKIEYKFSNNLENLRQSINNLGVK